jgi:beta-xylosidase
MLLNSFLSASCLWVTTLAAPLKGNTMRQNVISHPVFAEEFPDPCVISNGGKYYAFATNRNGVNVQAAQSLDFKNWTHMKNYDALPSPGSWVNGMKDNSGNATGSPDKLGLKGDTKNHSVWAPDVVKIVSPLLLRVYFSAA